MIIAVDGPAGAGKGTIATFLANFYNLRHLDTGLLYRAVALKAIQEDIPFDKREVLSEISSKIDLNTLNDPVLRNESTASMASKIAVYPEIREILTAQMRAFCSDITLPYKGAVLDGRDIGTVVCPGADIKFFITATPEIRAERRQIEMRKKDQIALGQDVIGRDARDSNRSASPLTQAFDAHLIDTTNMTIEEACQAVSKIVDEYLLEEKTRKVK